MAELFAEMKIKRFYWVFSLLIAIFGILWTLTQASLFFVHQDSLSALTTVSGLFMSLAFLTVGLRNRNRTVLRISDDSVFYMGAEYPVENIRHIGLNHPGKIVLWIVSEGSESRKTLNLKLIDKKEHHRILESFSALKLRLSQRESEQNPQASHDPDTVGNS